jgi:hypothetical protein
MTAPEECELTIGVAQKYRYISKMDFHRFNGQIRGYKYPKIFVQHHWDGRGEVSTSSEDRTGSSPQMLQYNFLGQLGCVSAIDNQALFENVAPVAYLRCKLNALL